MTLINSDLINYPKLNPKSKSGFFRQVTHMLNFFILAILFWHLLCFLKFHIKVLRAVPDPSLFMIQANTIPLQFAMEVVINSRIMFAPQKNKLNTSNQILFFLLKNSKIVTYLCNFLPIFKTINHMCGFIQSYLGLVS